jgi:hypothetical protein
LTTSQVTVKPPFVSTHVQAPPAGRQAQVGLGPHDAGIDLQAAAIALPASFGLGKIVT